MFPIGAVSFEIHPRDTGSNKSRDIPLIQITFEDGQKDELVLKSHFALTHLKNTGQNRMCNYLGHLKNEVDAIVAVTGCVDEKNPHTKRYISLLSTRSRNQKYFSVDFNGNVEPIHIMNVDSINSLVTDDMDTQNKKIVVEGDQVDETEGEIHAPAPIIGGSNPVPYAIKAKIKLGVDQSARDTITNRFNTTLDAWLAEVFTHVQAHYRHPTLRHRINFEVRKFYNYDINSIRIFNSHSVKYKWHTSSSFLIYR